jgi:hypothetical protein
LSRLHVLDSAAEADLRDVARDTRKGTGKDSCANE